MEITLINGIPTKQYYVKDNDVIIDKNQPQLVLNRNDNTTSNIIGFNTSSVQKWQIATSTLNEQYLIIFGLNNNGLYLWRFDQTNGLLQFYDGTTYHTFWHDGNFQPSNYTTLTTFNNTITGLSSIFLGIGATAVNSTKWNNLIAPSNPASLAFMTMAANGIISTALMPSNPASTAFFKMASNGTFSTDTNTYVTTAGTAANSTLWNNQALPSNPASIAFFKMASNGTFSTDTNTYVTTAGTAANSTQWNSKNMPANAIGALVNDGAGNLSFGKNFQARSVVCSVSQNSASAVYQAATDGFLWAQGNSCNVNTDASNPPTTSYPCNGGYPGTMLVWVKKGNYYQIPTLGTGCYINLFWFGIV